MQTVAGFHLRGPRIGQRLQRHRRCRAGGVDLEIGKTGPAQRIGRALQGGKIGRVAHLSAGMIVKLGRKSGDSGKLRSGQRVDPARGGNGIFGRKAAFVPAIEDVASRLHTGDRLLPTGRMSGHRGLAALSSESTVQ